MCLESDVVLAVAILAVAVAVCGIWFRKSSH